MRSSTNLALLRRLREATARVAQYELADLDRQIEVIEQSRPERPTRVAPVASCGPGSARERVVAMLRVMQDAGGPLRASEIQDRIGASRATTMRWLTSTVHEGFVERVGRGRYRVVREVPTL